MYLVHTYIYIYIYIGLREDHAAQGVYIVLCYDSYEVTSRYICIYYNNGIYMFITISYKPI